MKLLINSAAVYRSSRGVQRYYERIKPHLRAEVIESTPLSDAVFLSRVTSALYRGRSDYLYWSPGHRVNVAARHHVVTVHDCISLEYGLSEVRQSLLRALTQRTFDNAIHVVAISVATKSAILRHYTVNEGKITVIPSPAIVSLDQAPKDDELPVTIADPFVLMVTNPLRHKNGQNAVQAFAQSEAARLGFRLHVVGALDPRALRICAEQGIRLTNDASVTDELLKQYYSQCSMLLSVSLAEGHNLPIAEALSCGAPIVCSDIDVHREFYKDYAILVDPKNPDAIAAGISKSLTMTRGIPAPIGGSVRDFVQVGSDYNALFGKLSSAL
jgi:glycosyltransferase involved in cell wall biosynthesis